MTKAFLKIHGDMDKYMIVYDIDTRESIRLDEMFKRFTVWTW